MSRNLPALTEALEDWRDLAGDPDAVDALLHFDKAEHRLTRLKRHIEKLRLDPPQFDATDLAAVLDVLWSAQRMRQQIIEGNDIEVLVPTLRAFLYNEESLEEKLNEYPVRVRYAGHTILAELWGWTHIEHWPLYTRRSLEGIRLLGWQVPSRDYLAFARAFFDLRSLYQEAEAVAPHLPLNLEIDQFLNWANVVLLRREADRPTGGKPEQGKPRLAGRGGSRRSYAIREFGAPYAPTRAPVHAWPERPLPTPSTSHLADVELRIREHLALPGNVIHRAVGHLLAGRHLILTGPPGTGKSHLASLLAAEVFGYYPMLVTATAEWSAFDVVGGLVPIAAEDGTLRYDVRPGVVYEALRLNWLLSADGTVRRDVEGRPLRISTTKDGRQWPGVWLIIDELNRADVDKAFGDLFTALESGSLRAPRAGTEPSLLIPLPKDFRIIATLNSRDRHFLFTLSDALKRRFAFVEIDPPIDQAAERATLLARATAALSEQGVIVEREQLSRALDPLYSAGILFRAFHPLGTAPLLAALSYIGAASRLGNRPTKELVQEAVIAEILPQLEGMRELPLSLLAQLMQGRREAALHQLAEAVSRAFGDPLPLHTLRALAAFVSPELAEEASELLHAPPDDPATTEEALRLLDTLRDNLESIPAPDWPQVATLLESWLASRR